MKKLTTLLIIVALLFSFSSAVADKLSEYDQRIKGTWQCIGFYRGVSDRNPSFQYVYYYGHYYTDSGLREMVYPDGGSEYTLTLVAGGTDEVYLICNQTLCSDNVSAGQVFLSEDNKTMMILLPDGTQFFYLRIK